ncbi:hypothetical protein AMECASPLE_007261 [Ameca splendens]|uniref:Uncharacterized protein n=1 Tax=Ameca splendens TaxID=208324 RepID=A0ABV0YAW6_9TELE
MPCLSCQPIYCFVPASSVGTETENASPYTSSKDMLEPRLPFTDLSSERDGSCEKNAEIRPEHSTCRPSTSTKLSFSGEKWSTQLRTTLHQSEDKKDFNTGQNPTCDSTKADEKGHSSSSKAEMPLQPSRVKKNKKATKKQTNKKKRVNSHEKM